MRCSNPIHSVLLLLLCAVTLVVYSCLIVLSLGSGWSFPNLLPDRMDLAPWKHFWADRDGLGIAALRSLSISLVVSAVSTAIGLCAARSIRQTRSRWGLFIAYMPFVMSSVVIGVCLFDLTIRLGLAGSVTGVILTQSLFATAFATVFFSEMWSPQVDRYEQLVKTLGGGSLSVWRHAIIPSIRGLVAVCAIQTALFSWLDYGITSIIGGGNVKTLTIHLYAYIREASVNQAAQSSLILLCPAIAGTLLISGLVMLSTRRKSIAGARWLQ